MKYVSALFIAFAAFLGIPAVVMAQNTGTLTVSPAYIEVVLTEPAEEQTIPIRYTNNSDRSITLQMFPLDFRYTDAQGTIGFLQGQAAGSYSYSLASFLSLEANELTIPPKQSREFSVLVRNRPDLSPGGHYAGVIGKVIAGEGTLDLGARVSPSVSSLIFLRKTGGERYNLSLREVDNPGSFRVFYPRQVQLEFQNEGNIHLVPYGIVEITDMFGRVLKSGQLNSSSFLVMPESRRNLTVELMWTGKSLPISFNTVTVRGNDSLQKTTFLYRNSFFFIHPGVLLLPILIGGGYLVWKRRKKPMGKKIVRDENLILIRESKSTRRKRKKK